MNETKGIIVYLASCFISYSVSIFRSSGANIHRILSHVYITHYHINTLRILHIVCINAALLH